VSVILENDTVQLLRTEMHHIPFVVQAESEHENASYIEKWSFEQHESALDNADTLHLIVKNATDEYVGYVILKGLSNPNDSIELTRIVITVKDFGYGKNVLSLIKKWCFEVKKAHRLWLDVKESNHRAQYVYKSQGFKQEGILRECFKSGNTYESLVVMAILSHEYHAE